MREVFHLAIVPFSDRLKEIRLNLGYSQQELADLLGTSKQVISRYENGIRSPKISVAAKYAKILNLDLNYLLGEESQEKNQEAAAEAADLSEVKANFIKSVKEMTDEQVMLLQAVVDQVLRENGMR